MEANELHLSSVMEVSSPWKQRGTGSFLAKIVRMENQSMAIILKEDPNKPLRYAYLSLLMGRKSPSNMQSLLNKIGLIKTTRKELNFENISESIAQLVPTSTEALHSQMHELAKKLENHSYTHTAILKLAHEFAFIDPLLVTAMRTVAEDNKMSHAMDWKTGLGIPQTEALMTKVAAEKQPSGLSGPNRLVLFFCLSELQVQLFRSRGVAVAKESECFQELSDGQTLRFQDYLMIEKVYSLL